MKCINARPEDVKEVERIMQNLRKNRNNYRKMHGLPMKRRRALEKVRNNELGWTQSSRRWLDYHRDYVRLGYDVELSMYDYMVNPVDPNKLRELMNYDLGDCSSFNMAGIPMRNMLYDKKIIQTEGIVKIVTSGEENGDDYS